MRLGGAAAFAIVIVLTATSSLARAQDETPLSPQHAEALERFEAARALYDRGDYRAVIAEFQRVYELLEGHPQRPVVLFNLARTYEELHRYDRAGELYRRYLEEAGEDAPNRADVEASLRTLDRLLGTVSLVVDGPERAEVWLGEWQVGEAPGEVRIPGGRHMLELRASGYETARREIEVTARGRIELTIALSALSPPSRGLSPALFAASSAIAVASLIVASGVGGHALALHDDAERCAVTTGCRLDTPERRAEIETMALTADVLFASAGVFAVASVVLFFFTDWGHAPDERRTVIVPCGAGVCGTF